MHVSAKFNCIHDDVFTDIHQYSTDFMVVADYYTYVAELCTEKDPDPAGSGYFKQHLGYVSCRNILKF